MPSRAVSAAAETVTSQAPSARIENRHSNAKAKAISPNTTVSEDLPPDSRLYHRRRPSLPKSSSSTFPPLNDNPARSLGSDIDRDYRPYGRGSMSGRPPGLGRPSGYGHGPPLPEIQRDYGPQEGAQLADAIPPHLMGIGPWSDRPSSSRAGLSTASDHRGDSRGRWSPTLPGLSPRGFGPQHRLPSISDISRGERDRWDSPSNNTSRPPTSYADDYNRRYHMAAGPSPFAHHPPYPPAGPFTSHAPIPHDRSRIRGRDEPSAEARYEQETFVGSPATGAGDDDADDTAGGTGKKKKRRVALSCAECSKRKQKCACCP